LKNIIIATVPEW